MLTYKIYVNYIKIGHSYKSRLIEFDLNIISEDIVKGFVTIIEKILKDTYDDVRTTDTYDPRSLTITYYINCYIK